MDRAEATGLGVATAGHLALLAALTFGIATTQLPAPKSDPIEVSFVEEVGQGADRSALARAIIGLGDTLRLDTIAEGIEMAEQRAALLQLGCTLGQGHYFWPALPAAGIEELLAAGRLPAAPAAL